MDIIVLRETASNTDSAIKLYAIRKSFFVKRLGSFIRIIIISKKNKVHAIPIPFGFPYRPENLPTRNTDPGNTAINKMPTSKMYE